MTIRAIAVEADGAATVRGEGGAIRLPALLLRERAIDASLFDPVNHQRLYDPTRLDADLTIISAELSPDGSVRLSFSDGARCVVDGDALAVELGWAANSQEPPAPEPWDATLSPRPSDAVR